MQAQEQTASGISKRGVALFLLMLVYQFSFS